MNKIRKEKSHHHHHRTRIRTDGACACVYVCVGEGACDDNQFHVSVILPKCTERDEISDRTHIL